MRISFMKIALLCIIVGNLSAEGIFNPNRNQNRVDFNAVDQMAFEKLVKESVPERFRSDFITYTSLAPIENRIEILAVAEIESDGWVYMRSHVTNNDGSFDIGPLMLNSKNINDKEFMRKYAPANFKGHRYNYYMVTCINYYLELIGKYGFKGALVAYNAGPRAWINGKKDPRAIPYSTRMGYVPKIMTQFEVLKDQYVSIRSVETMGAILANWKENADRNRKRLEISFQGSRPIILSDTNSAIDNRRNKITVALRWTKIKSLSWWESLMASWGGAPEELEEFNEDYVHFSV